MPNVITIKDLKVMHIRLKKKSINIIGTEEIIKKEGNYKAIELEKTIIILINKLINKSITVHDKAEYEWISRTIYSWKIFLKIHFLNYTEWRLPENNHLTKAHHTKQFSANKVNIEKTKTLTKPLGDWDATPLNTYEIYLSRKFPFGHNLTRNQFVNKNYPEFSYMAPPSSINLDKAVVVEIESIKGNIILLRITSSSVEIKESESISVTSIESQITSDSIVKLNFYNKTDFITKNLKQGSEGFVFSSTNEFATILLKIISIIKSPDSFSGSLQIDEHGNISTNKFLKKGY